MVHFGFRTFLSGSPKNSANIGLLKSKPISKELFSDRTIMDDSVLSLKIHIYILMAIKLNRWWYLKICKLNLKCVMDDYYH